MRKVVVIGLVLSLLLAWVVVAQTAGVQHPVQLAAAEYHGNVNSHVFHAPGCRYYNCQNCTAVFHSRQAAIQAGYRPCKICNP